MRCDCVVPILTLTATCRRPAPAAKGTPIAAAACDVRWGRSWGTVNTGQASLRPWITSREQATLPRALNIKRVNGAGDDDPCAGKKLEAGKLRPYQPVQHHDPDQRCVDKRSHDGSRSIAKCLRPAELADRRHPANAGQHMLPTVSGTAANAIAIAAFAERFGAVFCHENAHIRRDEANAVGFFSPGLELIGVAGSHGRMDRAALERRLDEFDSHRAADARPVGISLTQTTEDGTVYNPGEISEIGAIAKARGLLLHMDGARLANAVAALNCHPADITWRAGVDILSFGGTKNGTMGADAVVSFKAELARDFDRIAKRGGLMLSKQRFLSAQLLAYLDGGLWLLNAATANERARKLAEGLGRTTAVTLLHPVDANEVFVAMPESLLIGLAAAGYTLKSRRRHGDGRMVVRFVTSYATQNSTIEAFLEAMQNALS